MSSGRGTPLLGSMESWDSQSSTPRTPQSAQFKWRNQKVVAVTVVVLLGLAAVSPHRFSFFGQHQSTYTLVQVATDQAAMTDAQESTIEHQDEEVEPPVHTAVEWQQSPGSTFVTPQSRCSIAPDGTVTRPPPPSPDAASQTPFLFDLREEVLPSKEEACAHCPNKPNCEMEALPHACCGVCQFERRFCSKLYPGKKLSEAVAGGFMAQGHPLHAFTPCEFFQRIRGRTLWVMGDSQSWQFFYSVECFLREFAPSLQRSPPLPDPEAMKGLINARQKLCNKWFPSPPTCLDLVHGTRVCAVRVDSAEDLRERVLPTLQRHAPSFTADLVVYNTGLHYYDDVMCKRGLCRVPGPDSEYVRDLTALADWRAQQRGRLPHTIWMDTPAQHFPGTGAFAGQFRVESCEPLAAWELGEPVARAGGTWNVAAAPLVRRLADAHLRTWNASVPLWDSHMPEECTHWCNPSAYHLWLFLLNDLLRDSGLGNPTRIQGAAGEAAAAATTAAALEEQQQQQQLADGEDDAAGELATAGAAEESTGEADAALMADTVGTAATLLEEGPAAAVTAGAAEQPDR